MAESVPGRGPSGAPPSAQPGCADLSALLVRTAEGDEAAWRELLGLYARRVYAMARSRLGRDDLAEEITQSVFATVAAKLTAGGYTEQGRFESWLFRITMNRVRDEVRRSKHRPETVDPAEFALAPSAQEVHADAEELATLRDAIATLGDSDRQIIELRHHAQLSFKQIAEYVGEPVGTVLARHHRALAKLRDILETEADTSRKRGLI